MSHENLVIQINYLELYIRNLYQEFISEIYMMDNQDF